MGTLFFDDMLKLASGLRATDLHLCPGSKPLARVNGKLTPLAGYDMLKPEVITDINDELLDERRKDALSKNRVVDFSFSKPGVGRFRANIYSQRGTYAIAIRTLPFEIPKFDSLGLPGSALKFTAKTSGLYLATGVTGSGKSTTLASMIDIINENYDYHILTIEDPIEYLHRHKKSLVTQREIGEDTDSFASALRASLREDPDVIMVGEMRDPETISIAMTAAETGHLVFSTLHTVGAAKSVDRIIDAFQTNQHAQIRSQLAAVLDGIVSQQLIPRADKSGMALATEVMFSNAAIRNMIREGKHYQINSIIQTGREQGMSLMEAELARLSNEGVITYEEAEIRAQDKQAFKQFARAAR
jgi:twitching motility protein PilT